MSSRIASAEALVDTTNPIHPTPVVAAAVQLETKNNPSAVNSPEPASTDQTVNPNPDAFQNPAQDRSYSPANAIHSNSSLPRNNVISPAATGGKSQTVFIHKLYDMLEDASLGHLIWWTAAEDSFCLCPGEEFSNVLAQYFKHTNIASFIRQLNMYGFHKVNESFQTDDKHSTPNSAASGQIPTAKWEFRHSANQFRKGDVESLSLIKRKSLKLLQSHKEVVNLKSIPPTSDALVDVDHNPILTIADPHNAAIANQQYHRSLMKLLWDLANDASGTPSPKLPPRQPLYTLLSLLSHHGPYTYYPGPVLNMPVPFSPHSPRSPPPHEQPTYANPLPLRLETRHTLDPMQTYAMDQALHLRFLEVNLSLGALKSNYKDLLSKYDSLYALFQRSQSDLLQLTEVLEETFNRLEKGLDSDEAFKNDDEVVDRMKSCTPSDRCNTPVDRKAAALALADSGTSPMSVRNSAPRMLELRNFHAHLSRKIGAAALLGQKNSNSLQSYHLHEPAPSLPRIASYSVVPQHYPLNPNYGLYGSNSETGLRRLAYGEDASKIAQPVPNCQASALVDPLQPLPIHVTGKEEKKESGLKTPSAPASGGLSSECSASTQPQPSQTPYVQQYQPMALQANPLYYQHYQMRQEPQLRTASLPVVSNPLTQKLTEHAHQRYSLTNIYEHRPVNSEPKVQSAIGAVHTKLTSNPLDTTRSQMSSIASSTETQIGLIGLAQNHDVPVPILEGTRNQLPSMEELNKSLRSGTLGPGRVYDLLPHEAEESVKRRKFES